jgi:heavy metal translocating P-type ATPase
LRHHFTMVLELMNKVAAVERVVRRGLAAVAIIGLLAGIAARVADHPAVAGACWALATIVVVVGLAVSIARNLLAGRWGVDAIALLSMVSALALGEPLAGAVVAFMYAGGTVLEDFAVARAERDLRLLVDRSPRVAHRRLDHRIEDVQVEDVAVGDVLLVRAGEVVPVDGVVGGQATIDESALTGEPIPVVKRKGASIYSGSLNAGDAFEMIASSVAGESTYAGIVRLVTAAQTARAPFVRLADRYALLFLPVTLAVAGVAWLISGDILRSLAVLVAATPCPLILAAPVAFIAGVAQSARRGILVKGGGALEALARAHTVMFDKTGTLTVGGARLLSIEVAPGGGCADAVLQLGASLEQASHHVVAKAIVAAAAARELHLKMPEEVRESPGSGVQGVIDGKRISVGSPDMIIAHRHADKWTLRAVRRASWRSALVVFVAMEERPIGALLLADELRAETPHAIRLLRAAGVRRIVMVTGDRADAAQTIGAALDLDSVLADRVPSDKVDAVRAEQRLHPTIMVGDGINDAPALAAADVGIAMGAGGATASSEAADVVILADRIDRVAEAIIIAQRARHIAVQSIAIGMGLSFVAMLAATFGWLLPVPAALVQEAIDVAVILNALRAATPAVGRRRRTISATAGHELRHDHVVLGYSLDRLRSIADALDDSAPESAVALISEANDVVQQQVVIHERDDEGSVYPTLAAVLRDSAGLSAMSRAHREILHLARLLARLAGDMKSETADRYLVRDAQRMIESIEVLVRIHTAQEEDIYDAVLAN